jgi:hypothetical protein
VSDTAPGLDALAHAQAELAAAAWPIPDDFLGDVGPLAIVWYFDQLGWATLRHYTAMLANAPGETPGDDSEPVRALNALTVAVGAIDEACVILGLIDREAAAPG